MGYQATYESPPTAPLAGKVHYTADAAGNPVVISDALGTIPLGTGGLAVTAEQTSGTYAAAAGELVLVNTTSDPSNVTVEFPAAPNEGDLIGVASVGGDTLLFRDLHLDGNGKALGIQGEPGGVNERRFRGVGSAVYRFSTTADAWLEQASNLGALWGRFYDVQRATADAVAQSVYQFAAPFNGRWWFEIEVNAEEQSTNEVIVYKVLALIHKEGASLVEKVKQFLINEEGTGLGAATMSFLLDGGGTNIDVQIQGVAGKNLTWTTTGIVKGHLIEAEGP
jgi:hypothetical protein